jgi:uncharacterized protein (TIGR03435 family)
MYDPRENVSPRAWTPSPVPGSMLEHTPLYVLTSSRTYSAAEYVAYNLKMLKRATIVGETTRGGQHSGIFKRINDHFGVGVQHVAPINPYPVKGWEVIGVAPDVSVRSADALSAAVTLANRPATQRATAADAPPAFAAASVKVNRSGQPGGSDRIGPGGRFTFTNLSLQYLIRFGYERSPRSRGLEPFEVIGGPDWLASDRFDVNAIAGREATLSEMRAMVRTLLEDRFRLRAHYETRDGWIYRLTMSQAGKLGPQLRVARQQCEGAAIEPLRGITPGTAEPCGYFGPSPTVPPGSDRAYQAFRGVTMAYLGTRLYPYLGRRVVDATGLSGYYDGEFEFTAEVVMPPPPPGQPNPYDGRVLPSLFSVLPQQLGLKLEPGRGPVEVLVVDRAEHPTDD